METDRIYLQPKDMVYDAMLDMMELQKGEELLNDPLHGKLRFSIYIYNQAWEINLSVIMIDMTRCVVNMEIEEIDEDRNDFDKKYVKDIASREYALLDSLLLIGKSNYTIVKNSRSASGGNQQITVGNKNYIQPPDMLLNAIHDLAELQKGETVMCDSPCGIIRFKVMVYRVEREYRFAVEGIGGSRCSVTIELEGDEPEIKRLIDHEFALLEYVLMDRANHEFREILEQDMRMQTGNRE